MLLPTLNLNQMRVFSISFTLMNMEKEAASSLMTMRQLGKHIFEKLSKHVRAKGLIVLFVASSRIDTLLLPLGKNRLFGV